MVKRYVIDFETWGDEKKAHVWAWGSVNIDDLENIEYGNSISSFMKWLKKNIWIENKEIYVHNLKFDIQFILYELMVNMGYEWDPARTKKTFNTLITKTGEFYSLEIVFGVEGKKRRRVIFYDSMKRIPMPVAKIPKAFNLEECKLKLDYATYRSEGHHMTDHEREYLKGDLVIVAKALKQQFDMGLNKMTVGSNALGSYKEIVTKEQFRQWFPVIPVEHDDIIRYAYKGGYTFCNPKYEGLNIGCGRVFDVNSMYPSILRNCYLPFGMPKPFSGRYKDDKNYPLYTQSLICEFKLKEGYLPTIQLKNSDKFLHGDEYLVQSYEPVRLDLTSIDLKLLFDHYEVWVHTWIGGFKFQQDTGFFNEYIDYWYEMKVESKKANNRGMETISKLMLNSLYGKFCTRAKKESKKPQINSTHGHIEYTTKGMEIEVKEPVYTAMGTFVTAYARDRVIRAAQKQGDRFIYADTDSLFVVGDEDIDLDVHSSDLGSWGEEKPFIKGRFLRAKTYFLLYEREEKVSKGKGYTLRATIRPHKLRCAGMPEKIKKLVRFEEFHKDLTKVGKLMPKNVVGGVSLLPTSFTIM